MAAAMNQINAPIPVWIFFVPAVSMNDATFSSFVTQRTLHRSYFPDTLSHIRTNPSGGSMPQKSKPLDHLPNIVASNSR